MRNFVGLLSYTRQTGQTNGKNEDASDTPYPNRLCNILNINGFDIPDLLLQPRQFFDWILRKTINCASCICYNTYHFAQAKDSRTQLFLR